MAWRARLKADLSLNSLKAQVSSIARRRVTHDRWLLRLNHFPDESFFSSVNCSDLNWHLNSMPTSRRLTPPPI